jgi:hypothetical protein
VALRCRMATHQSIGFQLDTGFLLDTNVIPPVMRKRPDEAVVSWLDQQSLQDLWLPSVVVFELRDGVASLPVSKRRRNLEEGLDALLGQLIRDRTPLLTAQRPGRLHGWPPATCVLSTTPRSD